MCLHFGSIFKFILVSSKRMHQRTDMSQSACEYYIVVIVVARSASIHRQLGIYTIRS